ncbi:MAG: hypothetical protein CMH54_07820 [Myxococcales bacterium]|nr:hypothetical protein [Myxococcales bacterium]|tara:strand:- start:495 stop:1694 length:1200 start_codon:yes stop_codon:yes gene_type:complete
MKVSIPKIVLPIIAIGIGLFFARNLIKNRPKPKKKTPTVTAPWVEIETVSKKDRQITIEALGLVRPARTLVLQPEVIGRIVDVSSNLTLGGQVSAGEELLRIDARDYQLAVQQQRAQVSRAQTQYQVEKGRKVVAEHEWELMTNKPDVNGAGRDLALRKPQIKSARADLESARSALKRVQLSVDKTLITAPFNGVVQQENVEIGQLVSPQIPIATIVGTDSFWVQTSVPIASISSIKIPMANKEEDGAIVRVIQKDTNNAPTVRMGKVVRLLTDLDPRARLARLLVEVSNPLVTEPGQLPLLIGSTVHLEIQGKTIPNALMIPRSAVHNGNQVWRIDADEKLRIETVDIAWRSRDHVFVVDGLPDPVVLVVSQLSYPVEGMPVRPMKPLAPSSDQEVRR